MRDPEPRDRNRRSTLEQTEALLQAWGSRIRETAAYRRHNRVLDRAQLVRRMAQSYRRWDRVFRWSVAFTSLVLVVGLWSVFRGLRSEAPPPALPPVAAPGSALMTGLGAFPVAAPAEDLQRRLQVVLTALQKPHRACAEAPEREDFSTEFAIVQTLYRDWALRVGSFEDPYGQAVRQLRVVLLPCLTGQQARFLRAWARDTKQALYLGWDPGTP